MIYNGHVSDCGMDVDTVIPRNRSMTSGTASVAASKQISDFRSRSAPAMHNSHRDGRGEGTASGILVPDLASLHHIVGRKNKMSTRQKVIRADVIRKGILTEENRVAAE
jgi:hypothetical protein